MTRAHLLVPALMLAAGRPIAAQLPSLPQAGAPAIQLHGELGTFGELYNRTGAPGRRPDGTGRIYLNADATLFGSVTMGVTLLASTEDGTSLGYSGLPGRQSISQFGLHPRWRWGSGHVGSFSDNYSAFSYNAVQMRGAAVDLQPGRLRFGAFGGRAASAVGGGAVNGTYRRSALGGRVGYGVRNAGVPSSFVELAVVRVWDDPNSLPAPDTTLPPNAPAGGALSVVNPYAVTPEENVVVSTSGGLTLFQGKLAWRGELAGAVHTRDVRASELDSTAADVPGVLSGLITPRVGTHADYAFSSDLQLRQLRLPGATPRSPRTLTASLGFRHVGPGYTSLGVASLANDVQAIDARANVRFLRWSAQLQAGHQNDNLVGQKLNTTNRYRLGGTFLLRVSPVWNASFRGSVNTMANGAADSLQNMDYHAWTLGTGQSFAFGPRRRIESLSFDYSYQDAGDGNPLRSASAFSAHSFNARLAIRVTPAVQVTPEAGFTRSQSDTLAAQTRATVGLNSAWRMWAGRLTATAYVGRTRFSSSQSWMGVLGARLRVTDRDDLVLGIQLNRFADTAASNRDFSEQTLNLRWARRL